MNRQMSISTLVALAAFVVSGLAATPAFGQVQGWGTTTQPVSSKDLMPEERGAEAYSERWTFFAELDGGGYVDLNYSITNLGFGDRKGTLEIAMTVPQARTYEYKTQVSSDRWSAGTKSFSVTIAGSRLESTSEGFRMTHSQGDNGFELNFRNNAKMWQPGRGKLTAGQDFYRFALIAIQADVTGTVRIDGKDYEVKATKTGLGDYAASTFAPYNLANYFARFHGQTNDVFVAWRRVQTTEAQGGRAFDWILVAYKGSIVFSDTRPTVRLAHLQRHTPTGYRVPLGVQIDGTDGEDSVKLVLRGDSFRHIDLLDEYGAVARLVASTVTDPHQFRVPADFQLQMTIQGATAKVSGKAEYSLDFMNKRR